MYPRQHRWLTQLCKAPDLQSEMAVSIPKVDIGIHTCYTIMSGAHCSTSGPHRVRQLLWVAVAHPSHHGLHNAMVAMLIIISNCYETELPVSQGNKSILHRPRHHSNCCTLATAWTIALPGCCSRVAKAHLDSTKCSQRSPPFGLVWNRLAYKHISKALHDIATTRTKQTAHMVFDRC